MKDIERSIRFYATYAGMKMIHERIDTKTANKVVWLCDHTRPFAIVLIEADSVYPVLFPFAHLGVGCKSRKALDALCAQAKQEGILIEEPQDAGYPVGYWVFLRDPDGHILELSYGQEIGLTVKKNSKK